MTETDRPSIDPETPLISRLYSRLLGDKDAFPADEQVARRLMDMAPFIVDQARQNRDFHHRAVRFAAEAGIRQFLDIGSGLPTANNTHEVAQRIAPESKIVYVDNDPAVFARSRALLTSTPDGATDYLHADLRAPEKILSDAAMTLDFSEPVAVILVAVLHFVPDKDDPWRTVAHITEAVPSGSYLVASHLGSGFDEGQVKSHAALAAAVAEFNASMPTIEATVRSREAVARFADGWDMVAPGLVPTSRWRPEPGILPPATPLWAFAARKP